LNLEVADMDIASPGNRFELIQIMGRVMSRSTDCLSNV